jgi:hypothetical protein
VAVDHQLVTLLADRALEAPMGRVVLEHVHHVVQIHEGIIDGGDCYVVVLQGGAQYQTANAAKAIDANVDACRQHTS